MNDKITTIGKRNPNLPFHPGVRAGDFIYVSGQVAKDENGNMSSGNIEEETRWTIEGIRRILLLDGADLSDVVKVTVYPVGPARCALRSSSIRPSLSCSCASMTMALGRVKEPVLTVRFTGVGISASGPDGSAVMGLPPSLRELPPLFWANTVEQASNVSKKMNVLMVFLALLFI